MNCRTTKGFRRSLPGRISSGSHRSLVSGRRSFATLALPLLSLIAFSPVRAEEWIIFGPRALGMGGAGVATIRGGTGMYWNPAGLAMPPGPRPSVYADQNEELEMPALPAWDLSLEAGASVAAVGDTLETISNIEDLVDALDFDTLEQKFLNGTPFTPQELQDSLSLLEQLTELGDRGEGMRLDGSAGLDLRVWRFGLSLNSFAYGGAQPIVDLFQNLSLGNQGIDDILTGLPAPGPGQLNTSSQALADALFAQGLTSSQTEAETLVYQAQLAGIDTGDSGFQSAVTNLLQATQNAEGSGSLATALTNNQSGARLRGALLGEVGIGYAQPFSNWLSLGVTVKAIHGTTFVDPFTIEELQDSNNFFDDLTARENREETIDFGIDAGALVQPLNWLTLGVTGRNLNQPSFDFAIGPDLELDPQARAGLAVTPLDWLTLAADVDLFVNHSQILPGYESQLLGGGAEVDIFDTLFFRAGLSSNLRRSDDGFLIHAGLGLYLGYFGLDAAIVLPSDFSELDKLTNLLDRIDEVGDLPDHFGLSVMLGFNVPF